MPRPRFDKLDSEKRKAILDAAAEEFARAGYHDASFNRIIEQAGLSKGAMYYYFDDKRDLYFTVLNQVQDDVLDGLGPFPEVSSPEEFWTMLGDVAERAAVIKRQHPILIRLGLSFLKETARGDAVPAMGVVFHRTLEWWGGILAVGQGCGAVRRDLPAGLLATMLMGIIEGMDLWMVGHAFKDPESLDLHALQKFAMGIFKRLLMPGNDEIDGVFVDKDSGGGS